MASIVSVNTSLAKGIGKKPATSIELAPECGIVGDAHAGDWHRQVSLLALEDIEAMNARGAELTPGDFAENITTWGIELASLPVGTRLVAGEVELEVTQIGKKCHAKCAIHKTVGDCIMPRQGIFARVIRGGTLASGLEIVVKQG